MKYLLAYLLVTVSVQANDFSERVNRFLQVYKNNPAAARASMPVKYKNINGNWMVIHAGLAKSTFSKQDVISGRYLEIKNLHREQVKTHTEARYFEPWKSNDDPYDFLEMSPFTVEANLFQMEAKALEFASLTNIPWPDDYWAIQNGVLGARFNDPHFFLQTSWPTRFQSVANQPTPKLYSEGKFDQLSPAEKYDLLVGDQTEYKITVDNQEYSIFGSLNYRMWQEGAYYYKETGEVESWMGICHGWAAASYMVDHPKKAVILKELQGGQELKFYPADIKSLASLLWANVSYPSNFVGGRCNDKQPHRSADDRLTSADCLDTNPGTWHIIAVNQIAKLKRSFILDANFDYQVWNQPVYRYRYKYFRPSDEHDFDKLNLMDPKNSPVIELKSWAKDPYKKYRSPKAKYVVGVAMEVSYMGENRPVAEDFDVLNQDNMIMVDYFYDLELDEQGNIVGGEWYQDYHPDFLWTPKHGVELKSLGDQYLSGVWKDGGINPALKNNERARQVIKQSSLQAQPLNQIIQGLVRESRK